MAESEELQAERPPKYMMANEKEREILLSQCGTFSPDQRKIFHYLCDQRLYDVSYDHFIESTKLDVRYLPAELQKLMTKLRTRELGLLLTSFKEGKRVPDRVVLTEQGDARFYYHAVGDEMEGLSEKLSQPFPTVRNLEEKKIVIPPDFITPLAPQHLSNSFFEAQSDKLLIFSLRTVDKQNIIVNSADLKKLISFAMGKLQSHFQSPDLLDVLATMGKTTISEIKKNAASRKPEFWEKIAQLILQNMQELAGMKRLHLGRGFYQSVGILNSFVTNQKVELERKKAQEKVRSDKMKALETELRNDEKKIFTQEDLNTKLEVFTEDDDSFKEDFLNRFTTTPSKVQLPPLVFVNMNYIHRDNLYQRFVEGIAYLSEALNKHYTEKMEYMLKSGNREGKTLFTTRNEFLADVKDQIKALDPFVKAVIDRPQIFSEAFIHTARTKMKIKDVEKIKKYLLRYFKEGKVEFHEVDTLLELNVLSLFETAFLSLPVLKQLIIKILGRYQGYRERFIGQQTAPVKNEKKGKKQTSSAQRNASRKEKSSKAREQRRARSSASSKKDSGSSDHGIRPTKSQIQASKYNKKDQDDAWSRFGSSFKG